MKPFRVICLNDIKSKNETKKWVKKYEKYTVNKVLRSIHPKSSGVLMVELEGFETLFAVSRFKVLDEDELILDKIEQTFKENK